MNLAEIRKKAQQAQKPKEAAESLPVPVPVAPAPAGELPALPSPGVAGLDAFAASAASPVFPDQLGAGPREPALLRAGGAVAEPQPFASGTELPDLMDLSTEPSFSRIAVDPAGDALRAREEEEAPVAPRTAALPEPAPLEEAASVTTFPAIVAAPSPPGPLPPEELFDPLAVILQGRELAEAGEREAHVVVEEVASIELLCFRVANETYAIDILDIKEIMRPREVTEVPRVPSFVRGILSLRGVIIPVFDMRLRLGLTGGAPGERERVVVVKRDGSFCGVLVDEVVQVVRVPLQGIEPPPVVLEGIDREFVEGIGRVGGRMLILLDMAKVLDVTLG